MQREKHFQAQRPAVRQVSRSIFKSQCNADLDPHSATVHDFIAVAIAGSLGCDGSPFAAVKCVHVCVCGFCLQHEP